MTIHKENLPLLKIQLESQHPETVAYIIQQAKQEIVDVVKDWAENWYEYSSNDKRAEGYKDFQYLFKTLEKQLHPITAKPTEKP